MIPLDNLRREYHKLMNDERLIPSERDQCIVKILGEIRRPANVGEAKQLIDELNLSIALRTSEIPL